MIDLKNIPRTALIITTGNYIEAAKAGAQSQVYKVLSGRDFYDYEISHGSSAEEAAAKVKKHQQLFFIRAVVH